MYGIPRIKTWTTIDATILKDTDTLVLSQYVDWKVGEEIAIASTSFDHH